MDTRISPAKDARRRRILDVARAAFLCGGYAGTSMSSIATQLGGSKTTLWTYFSGKPDLFIAVADDMIKEYVDYINDSLVDNQDVAATLRRFGEDMLMAVMASPISALIRIVTAEAGRFAELGALFHQHGLGHGWQILSAYMSRAQRAGRLNADTDCLLAAQHFIALCQARHYQQHMTGGAPLPTKADVATDVDHAVTTFMRAFASHAPMAPPPPANGG
ncbi:MAG: TetR/AcrR family transcriptional regulator [Sphingopyxis sp.]